MIQIPPLYIEEEEETGLNLIMDRNQCQGSKECTQQESVEPIQESVEPIQESVEPIQELLVSAFSMTNDDYLTDCYGHVSARKVMLKDKVPGVYIKQELKLIIPSGGNYNVI